MPFGSSACLIARMTAGAGEPDTSDFYDMLDQAAADSRGGVGFAMRRANRRIQRGR